MENNIKTKKTSFIISATLIKDFKLFLADNEYTKRCFIEKAIEVILNNQELISKSIKKIEDKQIVKDNFSIQTNMSTYFSLKKFATIYDFKLKDVIYYILENRKSFI